MRRRGDAVTGRCGDGGRGAVNPGDWFGRTRGSPTTRICVIVGRGGDGETRGRGDGETRKWGDAQIPWFNFSADE
ncbi:MAG: hypothetical protein KFF73_08895 [Cyclobacteriaceae bacterium]|nr:hypothetical protein [Cyclobacteriaceae bacterium]